METISIKDQNNLDKQQEFATEQQILRMQWEIKQWRDLAAYLASCHAATLESLPKRTSNSQRERMVNICRNCVPWLRGLSKPRPVTDDGNSSLIQRDIQRCEEAARNHAA